MLIKKLIFYPKIPPTGDSESLKCVDSSTNAKTDRNGQTEEEKK